MYKYYTIKTHLSEYVFIDTYSTAGYSLHPLWFIVSAYLIGCSLVDTCKSSPPINVAAVVELEIQEIQELDCNPSVIFNRTSSVTFNRTYINIKKKW